ncbi:MAG TPA: CNNM domain-containing protein, partial [Chthoniobacterales bacterium]|nr:CNNM domain-containing protein [Chthoniobacterales bacterium]
MTIDYPFSFAVSAASEVETKFGSSGSILFNLLIILLLVFLNGFFVASEFALVKVRSSQLDALEEGDKKV